MADDAATSENTAVLDTSAAGNTLEGNESTVTPTLGDQQSRINGLMSKWQTEQAESARLRTQLTEAITQQSELRQQLADAQNGNSSNVTDLTAQVQTLTAEKNQLSERVAVLEAENAQLSLIADNPDLAPYRAVLPRSADKAVLDAAVAAVRTAREAEQSRIREALGGNPRGGGGGAPRVTDAPMSSAEVDAYLRGATSNADFDARLAQVNARLQKT